MTNEEIIKQRKEISHPAKMAFIKRFKDCNVDHLMNLLKETLSEEEIISLNEKFYLASIKIFGIEKFQNPIRAFSEREIGFYQLQNEEIIEVYNIENFLESFIIKYVKLNTDDLKTYIAEYKKDCTCIIPGEINLSDVKDFNLKKYFGKIYKEEIE